MTQLNRGLYANLEDLIALRQGVRTRRLKSQQKLWTQISGSHHALQKGRGMVFSEVRQYQPGDDVRTIDWRVTARTQKPYTKIYTEEQEQPVVICLQLSPELFFGSHIRFKSVQALQVAAIFAWLTLQQNDRIGSYIFNHQQGLWIAPKHRQTTVMKLLQQGLNLQKQLKRPQTYQTTLWANHLRQMKSHLKPGGQLILIGDFLGMDAAALNQIQQLKRQHDLIACHIYDRLERQLPHLGSVKLSDGETEIQLDSEIPKWRQLYQAQYENRLKAIKTQLMTQKVPFFELRADVEPIAALLQKGVIL